MNLRKLLSLICALTLICSLQLPTTAYELNKQDSFSAITTVEELKHESVMYDNKATAGSCSIMTLDNSPSVTYTYHFANAPDCENDGNVEYWESTDGKFYTDENGKTEILSIIDPATGHKWGEPLWKWNGYDSATATFTCKNDDSHVRTVEAVIKKKTTKPTCENKGSIVYTATVEFNDNQYTDTKTEILPATGHDYENPEWNWSYSWQSGWSATARLTCENDKTHSKMAYATVTTKKVDATCDTDGSDIRIATVKVNGKTFTTTESDVIYSTGHSYGEPKWTWNGYDSATATFTCKNDDSHVQTVESVIKKKTTEPTCENKGSIVYTATVEFNGNQYTDTKTEILPATGHDYENPEWNWSYSWQSGWSATARLTCENDKTHSKIAQATVTTKKVDATCDTDGSDIRIATVKVNGKTFTTTESDVIYSTGHSYGEPKWTWNGYDSATATFTCKNDDSHVQTVEAVIKKKTTEPTCENKGSIVYTAKVEFNDNQYTDTKTEILPATGHDYENPEWNWSYSWQSGWSATARLTCENDKTHSKIVQATVTTKKVDATCDMDGSNIRIATVKVSGKTFTTTESDVIYSTGHSYGEPEWTWNDYSSAVATFTCKNDDSHIETSDAAIKTQTTLPTCESNGQVVYTATVEFDGKIYTDSETQNVSALGHKYNISSWNWYGYEKAIVTLTCENDKSHTKYVKAEVTSEKTDDGKTIYTATVIIDGIAYTNEKIKNEDYLIGIIGDMDGDGKITSADSLLILRQSVSLENFSDEQLLLADVDGDNRITSADALEVLRFSVSLPTRGNIGNEMIK